MMNNPEGTEQETLRNLFTLDEGQGFAVQLVIWPNDVEKATRHGWDADFMIQTEDLNEKNIHVTLRKLKRFLSDYKKKPLHSGVAKQKRRTTAAAAMSCL